VGQIERNRDKTRETRAQRTKEGVDVLNLLITPPLTKEMGGVIDIPCRNRRGPKKNYGWSPRSEKSSWGEGDRLRGGGGDVGSGDIWEIRSRKTVITVIRRRKT